MELAGSRPRLDDFASLACTTFCPMDIFLKRLGGQGKPERATGVTQGARLPGIDIGECPAGVFAYTGIRVLLQPGPSRCAPVALSARLPGKQFSHSAFFPGGREK